jgi:ABC-2 type transport system ATP-binding protein
MIELTRASRWYGQVIGLNDVSCTVPAGVTALLGPNGAGKSTFMKLVSGQLRPTTGTVSVFGERPFANNRVFRRLGYCPEIDNFYEDMPGREFVLLLATMAGFSGADLKRRVDDVIERVGMSPHAGRKIGGYSKGMRQRIKLAQAMVHEPDLILLDEPLNGLDPMGRHDITEILRGLGEAGKCVLVSSHILYEVEQMTRNILLVNRGRLRAQGDIYQIRSLIDKHPHRISITTPQPRELGRDLLTLPRVASIRFDDRDLCRLEVETRDPETFYTRLPEVVLDGGYEVEAVESPDNNLEAVFRYLVEE